MKITIKTKSILFALTLMLSLSSCMKDDIETTPISISGLSLIHASPTTEKLDIYVDNTRANSEDFGFGSKIDYLRAYSGGRTVTVTKKGLTANLTSDLLTLVPELAYSVFVVDNFQNIDLLTLTDDLTRPATGKAKIRFVNLSPDGGPLNLELVGLATNLVDNKAFKEFSTFQVVDAASQATFNIKNRATNAVEATLADVRIEDGKIYTIYAKGLKSTTDATKFGIAIFTHK